jgi:hypothetical protein
VNRVADAEISHCLRLYLQQLIFPVVHGATNLTFLPARPLHLYQSRHLRLDLLCAPWLLGQCEVLCRIGVHKLGLEGCNGGGDLLVDLSSDAWGAQEELVRLLAQKGVCVCDGAEDAMAVDKVVGFAGPAQEEDNED